MTAQQTMLSANKASKQWGKSRNTIKKDIENGLVSADKDNKGGYLIQVSELLRVYGEPNKNPPPSNAQSTTTHAQKDTKTQKNETNQTQDNPVQSNDLQNKVNLYAQEVRHLRQRLADLEKLNDKSESKLEQKEMELSESIANERKLTQTVTALLTAPAAKKKRGWFWFK